LLGDWHFCRTVGPDLQAQAVIDVRRAQHAPLTSSIGKKAVGQASMLINTFLVEDHLDIRDTLIQAMEEIAPCRFVGHADSEAAARRWLQAHDDDWQLAIIDLFLAEGSGFGILKDCQVRRADQKVVVLTSYSRDNIASKCRALGADEVFDKAGDLEKLVDYCRAHAASLHGEVQPSASIARLLQASPRTHTH
jgi:DNA-binding NarL/FixJ family response regulator